jgi:hypothetical protein
MQMNLNKKLKFNIIYYEKFYFIYYNKTKIFKILF